MDIFFLKALIISVIIAAASASANQIGEFHQRWHSFLKWCARWYCLSAIFFLIFLIAVV